MHAALKLQCGRVTGNKKSIIGGLIGHYIYNAILLTKVTHNKALRLGNAKQQ